MTILYFHHDLSCIDISNQYQLLILISDKRSHFTFVFFKAASYANPRAERNFAGSSLYICLHIFLKFSKTSANNNVSL